MSITFLFGLIKSRRYNYTDKMYLGSYKWTVTKWPLKNGYEKEQPFGASKC
jgi:hypothetical protein